MSGNAGNDPSSALDQRVIDYINKHALPGMGVGVVRDGKLIYARGFGLADAETQRRITAETNFRIASVSKTSTAIAVMQLWEQGKFQLEDPVNRYLKTYQVLHPDRNAPPVTIRHLLTHTSGIGEMRSTWHLLKGMIAGSREMAEYKKRVPPLSEYYSGLLQPDVHPDKKWAYANDAFATLGQLIEDVSGENFCDYMIAHVFEPLGMHHTDYTLSDRVKEQLAHGYVMNEGTLIPVGYVEHPHRPAGSVMSSVNEMGLYLAALMNGGSNEHGSVIKPETLDKMMQPFYQEHPHLGAMGLGFFLENLDGHRAAWHGGFGGAFASALWVAPDDKLGVFMSANSNSDNRMIYHFGRSVLRSFLGLPDYERRSPGPGIINTPHLWKDMVGSYAPSKGINSNARIWMTLGGELQIYVEGTKLMVRSLSGEYQNGIELVRADGDDPLAFDNVTDGRLMQLAFLRNAAGSIDRLGMSSGASYYTFYKTPEKASLRYKKKMLRRAGYGLGGLLLLGGLFARKK